MPGVKPRDASDRLIIFQNTFDTLYRKYITYTGGEELFGLTVTPYPQLLVIKKELNLLQVNSLEFSPSIVGSKVNTLKLLPML